MTQALTAIAYGASAAQVNEGPFGRIRKAIADYRRYLATLRELERLSDRELSDLGIHRAMIGEIARDSVYGA